MKIDTKTVTTRVHNATASGDELKGVAIVAVKNQLGLAEASILTCDATVQSDGSITVEVVEAVPDVPATAKVDAGQGPTAPPSTPPMLMPGLSIPTL